MAERRELSDRQLVHCLLERQMPLLAIGLGMQQLN
jgi:gamma-glutamyl-gamma-aminobutyrate hydrolase PuuD